MKSVLISIKPKWCELIATGEKTIEVRKTRPKIETPFKCYIYCTKPTKMFRMSTVLYSYSDNLIRNEVNGSFTVGDGLDFWANETPHTYLNGYVIGEFVCDCIKEAHWENEAGLCGWNKWTDKDCLAFDEFCDYAGEKDILYGWHISNLVIYDEPKELSDFKPWNRTTEKSWCSNLGLAKPKCEDCHYCKVTRPPQSYMFVDELR